MTKIKTLLFDSNHLADLAELCLDLRKGARRLTLRR